MLGSQVGPSNATMRHCNPSPDHLSGGVVASDRPVSLSMRLAAIDIGTNSIHMIVVQVRPDLSFEIVDREKEMVRLGAGGPRRQAAVGRRHRRGARHAEPVPPAGRIQAGRRDCRRRDQRRPRGAERRRVPGGRRRPDGHPASRHLGHRGSAAHSPGRGLRRECLARGPRSSSTSAAATEITLGTASEVHLARSFKLGVIRLTERFVSSDPLVGARRAPARQAHPGRGRRVRRPGASGGFDRVIATSGHEPEPRRGGAERPAPVRRASRIHHSRHLGQGAPPGRARRSSSRDMQKRLRLPGLDSRRADLIVAGAVLLDTIVPAARRAGRRHAVRLRPARRARPRLHRAQPQADRAERSATRTSAGGASSSWASGAAGIPSTRSRSRAWRCRCSTRRAGSPRRGRPRARVARVRRAAARHRRPHQLRGPPPALVLPDSQRRPARIRARRRSRRSRSWRATTGAAARRSPTRRWPRSPGRSAARCASARHCSASPRASTAATGRWSITSSCSRAGDVSAWSSARRGPVELERWAAHRQLRPLSKTARPARRDRGHVATYAEHADNAARVSRQAVRRRGHRRLGKDDAAWPAGEVADRGRAAASSSPSGTRRRW